MTSKPSGDLKQRLLQFLAGHPHSRFRPKQLARRLGVNNQEEYRELTALLNDMSNSNLVDRARRKRYGQSAPRRTHRAEGIMTLLKQGQGLVSLLPPQRGTAFIQQSNLGTALDGDTVAVELFAPTTEESAEGTEERLEGEVVEVLERSNQPIVGVVEKSRNFFFVAPDDHRIGRDIYLGQGKTMGARPGQKVVAVIDDWASRHLNPEGHVVEVLGRAGEVSAEMASVARQYRLPLHFPKDVSYDAEKFSDEIARTELERRLDFRDRVCFTIDPEDAKDYDDAVSLEVNPDGTALLGVHIADVSHYVREGSVLDKEAFKRGTSVYLANEVIPMLPEKLSNNICSLLPKKDRLTYTVLMTVDGNGSVLDHRIEKSVIHSVRRFTYEEVQKLIDGGRGEHSRIVGAMQKLSRTLNAKRMKEGSIDFESVETKFRFDENGKPAEIIKKARLDAHRLVEEFMLLANQVVARHIGLRKAEGHIRPFVYRIHDKPDPDKLRDLASFVEHLGYSLNIGGGVTSRALQKLLKDVKNAEEENVVNEVAIRSMAKAIYSETNIGHFGLGFRYYTHFTSPIRRYPDLIVHRLLHEYAGSVTQKRRLHLAEYLPEMCKRSSDMERVAMEAERASVKVMQVEYMKRHVGDEFHAIVSGVTNFGMFVEISDLLVEGLIRVRDLEDDYYVHDEKHYALIGRRTKKRFRLGDKVVVKVVRVDPEEREIDFVLVK